MSTMKLWISGLLIGGAATLLAASSEQAEGPSQQEPPRKVEVVAKRFRFVPSQIRVEAGETIEIELSSQDVMHGFQILDSDIETKIPAKGQGVASVRFRADATGKFPFRCSHKCGAGHAQMRGVIVVQKNRLH